MKIVYGNKSDLEKVIANDFANIVNNLETSKIILATGNSPVLLYKEMINLHSQNKLSFKNVTSWTLALVNSIEWNTPFAEQTPCNL